MSFKYWEILAKTSQKWGMGGMVEVRGAAQNFGTGMGAGGMVGWVTVYTLNAEVLCPSWVPGWQTGLFSSGRNSFLGKSKAKRKFYNW